MIALFIAAWLAAPAVAAPGDAVVVARVPTAAGEVDITAGRLRAYVAEHPGRPVRAALDELIGFELLAGVARQRGYAESREVREAADAIAVRAWLKQEFEPANTAETIPVGVLRQAYDRNLRMFKRPDLRGGDHLIVTLGGKRPTDPAQDAAAKALAERIRRDLDAEPPQDALDFLRRGDRYQADAKASGLEIRAERLGLFGQQGKFDPTFTEVCFREHQAGALTPAFASPFGWHVVRIDKVLPPLDVDFEAAIPELRTRTLDDYRAMKLRELTESLQRAAGVFLNLQPLEELEARRGAETASPPSAP